MEFQALSILSSGEPKLIIIEANSLAEATTEWINGVEPGEEMVRIKLIEN